MAAARRICTLLRPSQVSSPLRAFSTFKLQGINFGADGNHWLIRVKKPDESLTRDQIIDRYIKLMATVLGSEEDAKMKIYSVSTRHYYAIGALINEELALKLGELSEVIGFSEDTYIDAEKKDYGGEPFIDGRPVPYHRSYHASYWAMQEGMYDSKDAGTHADDTHADAGTHADVVTHAQIHVPRAWWSKLGVWWNGPSP